MESIQKEDSLWTFIVEWDGGTFISQYHAADIHAAIDEFNRTSMFKDQLVLEDPVRIRGCTGVWCPDATPFNLVNIVETVGMSGDCL